MIDYLKNLVLNQTQTGGNNPRRQAMIKEALIKINQNPAAASSTSQQGFQPVVASASSGFE
jgi:hypothetical protein